MKYIIDEVEFYTERKESKVCKYSLIVSQCISLGIAGFMLAYSVANFGMN